MIRTLNNENSSPYIILYYILIKLSEFLMLIDYRFVSFVLTSSYLHFSLIICYN